MTPVQPLLTLLETHERERDAALVEHRRAVAASEAAAAQAMQLHDYRRSYEQRWNAQFASEGRIALVHCYQSFNQRLTLAVDQQALTAQVAAEQVVRALARLQQAELRCASVQKLIERRGLEQRLADQRRDQRQTDEFAARAAWSQDRSANHLAEPTGPL